MGPAPITSTSTELKGNQRKLYERADVAGGESSHFFLGGSHGALQELLKTRNSLQLLVSVSEHVLDRGASSVEGSRE